MSARKDYPPMDDTNQIVLYGHCRDCIAELPEGVSPQQFVRLEVGMTRRGMQLWCQRHDQNVLNIDFEGHKHPAITTTAEPRWTLDLSDLAKEDEEESEDMGNPAAGVSTRGDTVYIEVGLRPGSDAVIGVTSGRTPSFVRLSTLDKDGDIASTLISRAQWEAIEEIMAKAFGSNATGSKP